MATKDWRKKRNSNSWSNGADSILLMSNNAVYIYPMEGGIIKEEPFKNRQEAIKFIKKYMRTH